MKDYEIVKLSEMCNTVCFYKERIEAFSDILALGKSHLSDESISLLKFLIDTYKHLLDSQFLTPADKK